MWLGLIAFLVGTAYIPKFADASTAPKWAVLSVGVPLIWAFAKRTRWTWGHLVGFAFLSWSAASLLWTVSLLDSLFSLWQLVILGLTFCLGAAAGDLKLAWIGVALAMWVSGLLAIIQLAGWSPITETVSPSGLFCSAIFMAEAGAFALVALIGRWNLASPRVSLLALGPALATFLPVLSRSTAPGRGALLGVASAGLFMIWRRSRGLAIAIGFWLAVGALWWHPGQDSSINERLAIWSDTWNGVSLLGHGVGSYYVEFPHLATALNTYISRPEFAHDEFLHFLFELGWPGLGLLAGLGLCCWRSADADAKPLLVCGGTLCIFDFPFHIPTTAFILALALGHAAGSGRLVRDSLFDWGISLCDWLAQRLFTWDDYSGA